MTRKGLSRALGAANRLHDDPREGFARGDFVVRTIGQRGIARLGWRAAVVALLDLAIVTMLVAHVAGGSASGASPTAFADSDPVRLLGLRLDNASCPTAPLPMGEGTMVVCAHFTAVLSVSGVVEVVSMYGPGNSVVDPYAGALPQGLSWGESIGAAWNALGRPNRITSAYGTPTLVYFFDGKPYGSLELRFDGAERLMRVNASLVH
jgi:hypothetical protein